MDEHQQMGTEIEELKWESDRDWERPTRSRVVDVYLHVNYKVSIRNNFHSSKGQDDEQRRRIAPPFSLDGEKDWPVPSQGHATAGGHFSHQDLSARPSNLNNSTCPQFPQTRTRTSLPAGRLRPSSDIG